MLHNDRNGFCSMRGARDGDLGAIFGIGFPPFLGGPFRYMDQFGIKELVEKIESLIREHAFSEEVEEETSSDEA